MPYPSRRWMGKIIKAIIKSVRVALLKRNTEQVSYMFLRQSYSVVGDLH